MTIQELLEELNISVAPPGHHHGTEGWVQFDCPFCGRNSGKYHMGYNINGGFTNCWQCGAHSLPAIIQEYTGWSYGKVYELTRQLDRSLYAPSARETKGVVTCPKGVGPLKSAHEHYLVGRGFDVPEIQRLWQIKGLSIAGPFSWRIFIPIQYQGRTVSWTTRSLSDKGRRYLSASGRQEILPHKDLLYGWDYVRHTVIIVEGPLDVWAVGPGAVATFGINFSPAQVHHLCGIPRRYVCFDREYTAQRQAKKLCDRLGAFPGETVNVVLEAKDPAASKSIELRKLRKFLE